MKRMSIVFLFWILLFSTLLSAENYGLTYVFPLPNSVSVSPYTTIIVKTTPQRVDQILGSTAFFTVTGSQGNFYAGTIIASDDPNTCIFKPDHPFESGDWITVRLNTGLWENESFSYSFQVKDIDQKENANIFGRDEVPSLMKPNAPAVLGRPAVINGVAVPSDFPVIEMNTYGTTAPGKILCGTIFFLAPSNMYLLMLNNDGSPYYYKRGTAWLNKDFAVQPTGDLTVCVNRSGATYIVMDSTFTEIDTYRCGHGYETDSHDFLMTTDGHAFMIGLEYAKVDLSQTVPGGRSNATAIASVVQELDEAKNIIFEWRTMDHMRVEDAVFEDLTQPTIDASHLNSVAIDYDGQLLISQKTQSEVSKIDRQTGEFIWRLGGVHNQFTLVNEDIPISYQHHLRPVPGKPGYYTLFDNGNSRDPKFSRAVEYKIDPVALTAEKVWEYTFAPAVLYTEMMGSVQHLPNGNRMIDGSGWYYTWADEVNADNELMQHMYISGIVTYRTMRFEWNGVAAVPDLFLESDNEKVILGMNKFGDTQVDHFNIYHGTSNPPTTFLKSSQEPLCEIRDLENQITHYFRITAVSKEGIESPPSDVQSIKPDFYTLSDNMIQNYAFDTDSQWVLELSDEAEATGSIENGEYHVQINNSGTVTKDIQLIQGNLHIEKDKRYMIEFDGHAKEPRSMDVRIEKNITPFTSYARRNLSLTTGKQHFSFEFEMQKDTDSNARINFQCGKSSGDLYFDNVSVRQIMPTSVHENSGLSPDLFVLSQNYPNPFNASTNIEFYLEKASYIRLSVYNMRGQRVHVLEEAYKLPGNYTIRWNGENEEKQPLPSGVYLISLQAGSLNHVRKLLLLR